MEMRSAKAAQKQLGEITEEMNQEAEGRTKDLRRMLAEWSEVQRVMRITRSLTEEEVVFIEKAAPVFVRLVHSKLGIGKSKKLHEIDAHLGEFARRQRCIYLLGEEGAESKHAEMNRRARIYCRIQNMADRLALMTEMERFANSDIAFNAGAIVREFVKTRKRGTYKARSK